MRFEAQAETRGSRATLAVAGRAGEIPRSGRRRTRRRSIRTSAWRVIQVYALSDVDARRRLDRGSGEARLYDRPARGGAARRRLPSPRPRSPRAAPRVLTGEQKWRELDQRASRLRALRRVSSTRSWRSATPPRTSSVQSTARAGRAPARRPDPRSHRRHARHLRQQPPPGSGRRCAARAALNLELARTDRGLDRSSLFGIALVLARRSSAGSARMARSRSVMPLHALRGRRPSSRC